MDIDLLIRKYSLANAIKYEGKANPGNVLGKIMGEHPEARKKSDEVKQQVIAVCEGINALSLGEQKKILFSLAPELLEEKEVKKKEIIKALHNVVPGKVVMRFEPSPSGPMHIGHTYPLMLNYAYCKLYDGKLILRIADTNSDNIYDPAYEMLIADFHWLCPDVKKEVVVQSDRMEIYYKYASKLIQEMHAYVCTCTGDEFRVYSAKKTPCPCREKGRNQHEKSWAGMLDGTIEEGGAVVRLKTDIAHPNPAMRDFPLLRINESEHPRQGKKYRVWPLLNFAVAIDDHDMGLTHVLRGKDHFDNTKRQKYIFDYFGWTNPHYIHIGRINFEGIRLKTTITRHEIEEGTYDDWDDLRLPFLPALRRRGYQPHAFERYALSVGVTMNDKSVEANEFFKTINFFNKEKIEPTSNRYFFVENPKEITVSQAPMQSVELDLHPDYKKGGRHFETTDTFLISQEDYEGMLNGELIRFMDCLNFRKRMEDFIFVSVSYVDFKKENGKKIIHWLPAESKHITAQLIDDQNKIHYGHCEYAIKNIKQGDIVQFERQCYARLDKKADDAYVFVFTHK